MMKRYGGRLSVRAFAAVLSSLLLTGCGGSFPNMTDEQYNQVVEYAAGLLIKYSNNGVKKLTYLEPNEPVEGVDALPDELVASSPILNDAVEDPEPETELPSESLEDLPEEEFTEGLFDDEEEVPGESADDEVTVTQGDKQTLSNGLQIGYNGYAVYNYYPIEMSDVIISAELGNKLLVLSFFIENPTDSDLDIDMVTEDPVFRIFINNVAQGRYRPTILAEDLSTVQAKVSPGERTNVCLVVEVSEDLSREINSIRLSVKYDGKSQTATLN